MRGNLDGLNDWYCFSGHHDCEQEVASAFEEEAGDEEAPTGLGPSGSSLRQNSLPSLHQAPLHRGNVHEMWTLQVQAQPPVKRHLQVWTLTQFCSVSFM